MRRMNNFLLFLGPTRDEKGEAIADRVGYSGLSDRKEDSWGKGYLFVSNFHPEKGKALRLWH